MRRDDDRHTTATHLLRALDRAHGVPSIIPKPRRRRGLVSMT
jgi:hypothetical protein